MCVCLSICICLCCRKRRRSSSDNERNQVEETSYCYVVDGKKHPKATGAETNEIRASSNDYDEIETTMVKPITDIYAQPHRDNNQSNGEVCYDDVMRTNYRPASNGDLNDVVLHENDLYVGD